MLYKWVPRWVSQLIPSPPLRWDWLTQVIPLVSEGIQAKFLTTAQSSSQANRNLSFQVASHQKEDNDFFKGKWNKFSHYKLCNLVLKSKCWIWKDQSFTFFFYHLSIWGLNILFRWPQASLRKGWLPSVILPHPTPSPACRPLLYHLFQLPSAACSICAVLRPKSDICFLR